MIIEVVFSDALATQTVEMAQQLRITPAEFVVDIVSDNLPGDCEDIADPLPNGDELQALVKKFPAPPEWYAE